MAWKEARASMRATVQVSRHIAHSDDAKSRRDESSHDEPRLRNAGRSVGLGGARLAIAGAVGAVVVIAGLGAVAVNALGGDHSESASPSTSTSSRDPGGSDPSDGAHASPSASGEGTNTGSGETAVVSGTVKGKATFTFSKKGVGSQTQSGGIVFELDCSSGTTCNTSALKGTGGLDGVRAEFLRQFIGLAWTGGNGAWAHEGHDPKNCDEATADDWRPMVTGTLAIDKGSVSLVSSQSQYQLHDPGGKSCFGPKTLLSITGSIS